jgi:acid stress-induced BolA-like protein IbaG/YrbA
MVNMDAASVKGLLEAHLENCEITVEGEGSHYNILVIGDVFTGKRPVAKQQLVYAALNEQIADGSIHAVNIRTFTPQEWQAQASD